MTSALSRPGRRAGLVVTLDTLLIGSAGATTSLGSAGASTHHSSHRSHHASCIPQHGGGDRDSDNHGGPSDGDGCL
jgi:hypothetical protein